MTMQRLTLINALIGFLFIHVNPSWAIDSKPLIVGTYDLPPHLTLGVQDKKVKGALVDYLEKEVLNDVGVKIQWTYQPFSRLMAEAQKHKIDVIGFVAKNKERQDYLDFPDTATFSTYSALIFRTSNAPSTLDQKSLENLVIGHTQGSIVPDYLTNKKVKFQFLAGEHALERNLEKLNLKRLDAVFVPTLSHAEFVMKNTPFNKELKVVPILEGKIDLYVALNKNLDKELKNKILKKLNQSNGKYSMYLNKTTRDEQLGFSKQLTFNSPFIRRY